MEKKKKLLIVSFACLFLSCEKEEETIVEKQELKIIEIPEERGKLLKEVRLSSEMSNVTTLYSKKVETNQSKKVTGFTTLKRKARVSDLNNLGISKFLLKRCANAQYDNDVDGLSINDEGLFKNYTKDGETISQMYNKNLYIRTGKPIIKEVKGSYAFGETIYRTYEVSNPFNYSIKHTTQLTTAKLENSSYTTTHSVGVGYEKEIALKGFFAKLNGKFSINYEYSNESSNSTSTEVKWSDKTEFNIPPKTKVRIRYVYTKKEATFSFKIPTYLWGRVGVNLDETFEGHYFHFPTMYYLLRETPEGRKLRKKRYQKGEFTLTDVEDIKLEIEKIPL
ncbi:hypothetical protein ACFSTE_13480 [Aquimarina hainanensis]|uniref:Lipoprotein n=1 Tax=Aquimarina hainanensis TaxID=1578017 RepID=A0ABW5N8G2_9FLAO